MSVPTKIQIRGLYKIFGKQPQDMVEWVQNGLSKEDLLKNHDHVLGLQNINMDLGEGQISVIMGLSGSGKSTLIRHFNRLIEPTVGHIHVDGQDIMGLDAAALANLRQTRMSMVFQKFALLPHQNVLQNVALPLTVQGMDRQAAETKAQPWLDRVGLKGFEESYPAHLSGGMQQRVGIARALCADTPIMLMDEAFSALDPLIRADMQDLLLTLQQDLKKTIVFITHDLDEALRLADHLTILKDGALVQQGDPQGILLKPANAYVADFVSHINRARVIRARALMHPPGPGPFDYQVGPEDTLETLLTHGEGATDKIFGVYDGPNLVGQITMDDVILALIPRRSDISV